jgi:hypothetical protein
LSDATELKFFALIALTLTVLSGVYPLQFRGVDGDKDTGTGSGKPIPNLCTYLYCCPSFSKTINLSNDTLEQDSLHTAAAGSNIYILWTESAGGLSGPLFLVRSTDNGHTFGSKIELVGDIYNSNIAGYGNNVYVVFASSRGVFFIKSTDGGSSFGSPVKLNQLNGINLPYIGENTIEIETFGNSVYLVWTQHLSGINNDVFFIKSTDGGSSFTDKKNLSVNDGPSIRPKLEINGNNIYVVWEDTSQGNNEVFFKRSIDGGSSFGKWINLSNNPKTSTAPDIGSFGNNVYVIWEDSEPFPYSIILKKSTDGGHTFVSKKVITSGNPIRPLVDVSSDNKVYVVWGGEKLIKPYEEDIWFQRSANEGTSFSCLTKVEKSLTATIRDVNLLSTDVRLFVLWRNYVNVGEDDMNREVFFTASPP